MDKTKMPLSSITVVSKIENSQVTGLAVPSRSLMEQIQWQPNSLLLIQPSGLTLTQFVCNLK